MSLGPNLPERPTRQVSRGTGGERKKGTRRRGTTAGWRALLGFEGIDGRDRPFLTTPAILSTKLISRSERSEGRTLLSCLAVGNGCEISVVSRVPVFFLKLPRFCCSWLPWRYLSLKKARLGSAVARNGMGLFPSCFLSSLLCSWISNFNGLAGACIHADSRKKGTSLCFSCCSSFLMFCFKN